MMALPEFNEAGDLPPGVHQATLDEAGWGALALLGGNGAYVPDVCSMSTHWPNAQGTFSGSSFSAAMLPPKRIRTMWTWCW